MVDSDGLSTFSQTLTFTPEEGHNGHTLWCIVQHPSLKNEIETSVKLVLVEEPPEPAKLGPGATISIVIVVLIILSIITIIFIFYRTKMARNRVGNNNKV